MAIGYNSIEFIHIICTDGSFFELLLIMVEKNVTLSYINVWFFFQNKTNETCIVVKCTPL